VTSEFRPGHAQNELPARQGAATGIIVSGILQENEGSCPTMVAESAKTLCDVSMHYAKSKHHTVTAVTAAQRLCCTNSVGPCKLPAMNECNLLVVLSVVRVGAFQLAHVTGCALAADSPRPGQHTCRHHCSSRSAKQPSLWPGEVGSGRI
jgi:hypothetical protein